MPHKHRLPTSSKHVSNYDLPPTTLARALSVRNPKMSLQSISKAPTSKPTPLRNKRTSSSTNNLTNSTSSSITKTRQKPIPKSGKGKAEDDTPRAFARLLSSYHPPPRSGLDDGPPPSKKLKTSKPASITASASSNPAPTPATHSTAAAPTPAILPHESLSTYGARIDAMLPISGLGKAKGRGAIAELKGLKGLDGRKTKAERKMQKMQMEWRVEEARRKAKREELREEEEMEWDEGLFGGVGVEKGKGKRGKKGRDEEGDLWAAVGKSSVHDIGGRETRDTKEKGGGLVGLHDVVLAPPKFAKPPREKFKVDRDGGKGGVLGLKRQGELSDARQRVVEGYRALMREKVGEGTE